MNTAELKIDVINIITNLKEVHVIEEVKKLLDFEMETNVYQLNEFQKSRIIEAQKDEILTEEQANKEIEEWLQEKQTGQQKPIRKEKKLMRKFTLRKEQNSE